MAISFFAFIYIFRTMCKNFLLFQILPFNSFVHFHNVNKKLSRRKQGRKSAREIEWGREKVPTTKLHFVLLQAPAATWKKFHLYCLVSFLPKYIFILVYYSSLKQETAFSLRWLYFLSQFCLWFDVLSVTLY